MSKLLLDTFLFNLLDNLHYPLMLLCENMAPWKSIQMKIVRVKIPSLAGQSIVGANKTIIYLVVSIHVAPKKSKVTNAPLLRRIIDG